MSLQVMLSYPSEKAAIARTVYEFLSKLDLHVWFDKESLVAGDDWDREIEQALVTAELCVILTSEQTVGKTGVVQRELNRILNLMRDRPIGSNYIVNLRCQDVVLPPELAKFQWIDLYAGDWEIPLLRAVYKKFQQLERRPTVCLETEIAALNIRTETQPRSINIVENGVEFSASYFVYREKTQYWHYINSEVISHVHRDFYANRSMITSPNPTGQLEWSITAQEFFRREDLLSLRFFWYSNFGGAHPNHGTSTLNFGGDRLGRLDLKHLFAYNTSVIDHILKVCEQVIQNKFYAAGETFTVEFGDYLMGSDPWEAFADFSFSEKGLTFNLSPYKVMPYAFGSHEVTIAWDYFRDKISEETHSGQLRNLINPYAS